MSKLQKSYCTSEAKSGDRPRINNGEHDNE